MKRMAREWIEQKRYRLPRERLSNLLDLLALRIRLRLRACRLSGATCTLHREIASTDPWSAITTSVWPVASKLRRLPIRKRSIKLRNEVN